MKLSLTLTLVIYFILPNWLIAQNIEENFCFKTKNLKLKQIEQLYPFKSATKIKFVSFKTREDENVEFEIPKTDGKVDVSKLYEVKTVSKKQRHKLLDILVNYNYSENAPEEFEVILCYLPRNAILFENQKGEVINYIEICFECLKYKSFPEDMNLGLFCNKKYELIKELFNKAGITYGIENE